MPRPRSKACAPARKSGSRRGAGQIVANNLAAGRLAFTTDLAEGARGAQVIFIAVGTPTAPGDDRADLS